MQNNRLINGSYIGSAKVTVDILPKGYGIPNIRITPTSITIHNTGNNNSIAKNNHTYMKNINKSGERKASWHFTVDDKEIYQAQSTNFKCLHAGDNTGNATSIAIEICQFTDKDRQLKTYRNAIELVKVLMKYHNFSIDEVKQHNYWSRKNCPQLLRAGTYGYDWDWFINECKKNEDTRIFKIVTGGFGTKENAEAKANILKALTGWYLEIKGEDYHIETGGFTGETKVKSKLNALIELTGWWATYSLQ